MQANGVQQYQSQFELKRQEGVYENLATILLLILFPALCFVAHIVGIVIAVEEDALVGIPIIIASVLSAGFSILGAFALKYIVKLSKRVRELEDRSLNQDVEVAKDAQGVDINAILQQTESVLEGLLAKDPNGTLGVQALASEFFILKQQILAQPNTGNKELETRMHKLHAQVMQVNKNVNGGYNSFNSIAVPGMSFGDTFVYFFNHYADFNGRARRQEYWFMVLWNVIFTIIPFVGLAWTLATFVPSLALTVRRLHDTGRSGLYMLFCLIPLAGPIALLCFLATDSDRFTNLFGPSPKYR